MVFSIFLLLTRLLASRSGQSIRVDTMSSKPAASKKASTAESQDGLPVTILKTLDSCGDGVVSSTELADQLEVELQAIVGALKSLNCHQDLIDLDQAVYDSYALTAEGKEVLDLGSQEKRVFDAIPDGGIQHAELQKNPSLAKIIKIGFSKAMNAGWIEMDKKCEGGPVVRPKVAREEAVDKVRQVLARVEAQQTVDTKELEECKKRKLIKAEKKTVFKVKKGNKFSTTISKPETDLTADMISSGSWKDLTFKPLNFDAMGVMPSSGYLHPLLKIRAEYRQIFLEMGFCEMPTNKYVESSFWNFDALFQPQQHPARDAHDTFFLSDPETATNFPQDYVSKVKQVHSEGGFGSQGYKYDWKIEEAQKNILRTHTTAVSARMLYQLGQQCLQGEFKAAKYFSIDRVFRNETLDNTHLAEFHQIEGVVADRGLTLGDLMGVINEFFKKLGITRLRFKPAYNPYTEPSMEIFSYHSGLNKWVEIGNSGIFRPEMLLPMGLPEDVVVIAWGLSLERPAMIKYGIDNIRDLIGPKIDLSVVQRNPICRIGH